jgi:hypothetical protein
LVNHQPLSQITYRVQDPIYKFGGLETGVHCIRSGTRCWVDLKSTAIPTFWI